MPAKPMKQREQAEAVKNWLQWRIIKYREMEKYLKERVIAAIQDYVYFYSNNLHIFYLLVIMIEDINEPWSFIYCIKCKDAFIVT